MPCMCGDTHCPSCGPAQGNWRCPICGAWADDGCDHIGDDGNLLPEFAALAEEAAARDAEAAADYARAVEEAEDRYWSEQEANDDAER